MQKITLLKLKEVSQLTTLSRSSIYNKISEGTFPKQVSLGERAVAFINTEIIEWVNAKIQGKNAEELIALVINLTAQRQHLLSGEEIC